MGGRRTFSTFQEAVADMMAVAAVAVVFAAVEACKTFAVETEPEMQVRQMHCHKNEKYK